MDYKKFADLHTYLFGEVNKNWHQRGYLTPEEFFCIAIWKANRAKGKLKIKLRKLGELASVIKAITLDIHHADTDMIRLSLLIHKYKFRLPTATAICAVYSPDVFVLYDYRGLESLGLKDFSNRKACVLLYFSEYLRSINETVKGTAREQDAYIWGKSFYNDLKDFLKDSN